MTTTTEALMALIRAAMEAYASQSPEERDLSREVLNAIDTARSAEQKGV